MRRAVFRRTTTGMALFPFLAVLICTMGSLIVLLVLVLQQSRAQANVAREQQSDQRREESHSRARERDERAKRLRHALEDHEWRREMLEAQRTEQLEKLSGQRKELSHLEDHVRRLEDQWKKLSAQAQELERVEQDKSEQEKAASGELEKLKADIADKKKQVDAAKKKLAARPKSFAIVPYVGKNGTRRRPIYIECAEEGIILHPERVVFLPADFQGPLGPGNPLDAALRTVREHWASQPDASREGEPYPLLIVRPNGAVAYSMVRAAMKSWEEEFGYELVEEDMHLQFPSADPELENLLTRSIKDARARQSVLAASMPSRYKPTANEALVASPTGGFTSAPYRDDGGAPGGRGPSGGAGFGAGAGSGGAAGFGTGGGTGAGSQTTQRGGANGGAGSLSGSASGSARGFGFGAGNGPGNGMNLDAGGGTPGSGGAGAGTGTGVGNTGNARGGANGAGSQGPSGIGSADQQFVGTGPFGGAGGGASGANGQRGPAGSTGAGGAAGGGTAGGTAGGAGGAGGGAAGASGPGGLGAGGASSGSAGGAGMPNAEGTAGAPPPGSSSKKSPGATGGASASGSSSSDGTGAASLTFTPPSAARSRGQDWALRNKSQKATAITRPIRVRCQVDRLVILPERGDDQRPQVIPLQGNVQASLDPFVTAIWRQTERWGLAVTDGYWKPVLNIEVAPGAEANFKQLDALLQGSGLEVVRK